MLQSISRGTMRCAAHLCGIASLVFAVSFTGSAQAPAGSGQTAAPAASQAYGTAGAGQVVTVTPTGGQPSPGTAPGVTTQGPFQGSVPTGKATGTVLPITVKDALDRALKYNLGIIQSDQSTRAARAQRLRNLSALLPNLYGQLLANIQQVNQALRACGTGALVALDD